MHACMQMPLQQSFAIYIYIDREMSLLDMNDCCHVGPRNDSRSRTTAHLSHRNARIVHSRTTLP